MPEQGYRLTAKTREKGCVHENGVEIRAPLEMKYLA